MLAISRARISACTLLHAGPEAARAVPQLATRAQALPLEVGELVVVQPWNEV
jgi:hypothetical protein